MASLHDSTAPSRDLAGWLPVTAAQSEVWVGQQLAPHSPAYNIALTVEVNGPLDIARSVESVYLTIRRAEALHVRFAVGPDEVLRQQRLDPEAWTLHVLDLRDRPDPAAEARAWIERDMQTVAELDSDEPLFTQAILRIDDELTWWHQRYHHSVIDGYGIVLLVEEVVGRQEHPDLLFDERDWSLQTAIDADVAYRSSSRYEADRAHWLEWLADAPEPPVLVSPSPDPVAPPIKASVELDAETVAGLYRFADAVGIRRTRIPFAMIAGYLHRVSGQSDLMLSVPLTGRTGRALRHLPSMASTILPMRLQVDGDSTLAALTADIDRGLIGLLRRGRYRGEDLAREMRALDPTRRVFGPGVNIVLFDHSMTFGGSPAFARDMVTGAIGELDFTVQRGQEGESIRIDLRVGAGLEDDLERHRVQLTEFLGQLAAEPDAPFSRFDVMSTEQRRRVLVDWNDTAGPQPSRTVPELFAAQVAATPDAEALVAGDTRLTYRELGLRVNQLARHLSACGLQPEEVVAVGLPRSAEMVVGLLAIMSAGGAFVPLDPAWPTDRREQVLADAGARLVLTGPGGVPVGPESAVSVDLRDWAHGALSGDPVDPRLDGRSLAYVIFTSGSTGRPKGAMIRHEAICARLLWQVEEVLRFGADDASLFKAPLSFDISVNEILLPLVSGGRLVVADAGGERDPHYLLELIERERVTFVYLVSSMLAVLLDLAEDTAALAGLRHVWCGGEVLTPELFDRFRSRLGTTLYHGYGPAEATIGVSHVIYREHAERIATSIGRPNPNTQLYVLDSLLRPVPPGIAGELYAGGYLLGRGYVGASALTASRFVANPFCSNGSRLYRTGDLARWSEDGTLDFVGRADNQVKIRGMRLELEDVEAAVSTHPGVRQCAVLVRENGAAKYLAAYVRSDGEELDGGAVRDWVATKLPDYMVPTAVVVLDEFPLTANGKLDRRALPEPDLRAGLTGLAPRTELERTLATVVAGVLGCGEVGVTDDFFALGGDSIVAIQVVNHARAAGLRLSARDMFTLRTVAALARELESRGSDELAALPDAADEPLGEIPATPIVARAEETGEAVARFHQSVLVRTPAGLTESAVRDALAALLDRHPALRARLDRRERWLLEVTESGVPDAGELLRTTALPGAGEIDEVVSRETSSAAARLDPDAGVMLQAVWFDGGDRGSGRLLLVVNHLVVDGVSWRVLLEDLARAGSAAMAGTPVDLAPTGTSLRRWSQLLVERARAGAFDHELDHWRSVALPDVAQLGTRALDPALDVCGAAESMTVDLPPKLTGPLLSSVPAAFGGHVNDVLLTALAAALAAWDGLDAVVVDLEGHGREEDSAGRPVDLGRTVGWFTSLYPVRLEAGRPDHRDPAALAAALKAVKEQLRGVPGNGIGYGALRYLTDSGADLTLAADPQVLFNYLGRVTAGGADWLPEAMAGAADPDAPMRHAIEIDAVAEEGPDGPTLRTTISWAPGVLHLDRVEALSREWTAALTALAATAHLGGATPSDFPSARLSQADVDQLEVAVPGLEDVLAMTPLQEGIYFHSAFEDQRPDPYVVQQIIELTGPVEPAALASALQTLVDRHAALRTGLHALSDGRVVQAVAHSVPVPMGHVDLSGLDPDEAQGRIRRILDEERARGFDLERAPLVRYVLVTLSGATGDVPPEHRLLQSIHHIVADGWSVPVMLRELMALYAPAAVAPVLPAPEPYRNYLGWLGSRDREASLEVWRAALADVAEPTGVSSGEPVGPAAVADVTVTLSADRTAALAAFGRSHGLTLSTIVHGTWGLLLGRLTRRSDVLFGSTVSGRGGDLRGIESMVGLFINTVPARLRFRPEESAVSALARWQDEQSMLLDHQYLGLSELRRLTGLQELFDTLVVFENYPIGEGAVADPSGRLEITGITFEENPPYPVTLIVAPGDELRLEVKCQTSVVDSATATSLATGMAAFLGELLAGGDKPISGLALVSDLEREQLEAGWAASAGPVESRTLTDLLDEQAVRTPDAVAVEFGDRSLTYRQMHARANRLARSLVERGVGPESVVAIALGRSLELMVALLAVGKAGGAYLPLDLDYPAERLSYMLADAAPVCVLTDGTLIDTAVPQLTVDLSEPQADSGSQSACVAAVAANSVYLIYTSGSTGRPKGVLVPHRGVVNRLLWMQSENPLVEGDRVLQKTPSSFDVSVPEFFGPLIAGATVVLAEPGGHRDPAYLARLIADRGISRAHFVPSMLELFLAEPAAAQCGSLELVACSGEALPVTSARRFAEVLPGVRLDNLYGPTEAAVEVSYFFGAQALLPEATTVPIGSPVAATRLYVLDQYLNLVPPGSEGELYLSGPQLARGYLGRAALTADRFVADPFVAGERMYRTGDLVRCVDSELEYVGRADDQVKLHGFRIELGEVETALLADPTVARAAVVVREDLPGRQQLVAYLVPSGPVSTSGPHADQKYSQALRASLPAHMVPSAFVELDALPLTPSGKLDRKALPAPDFAAAVSDRAAGTGAEGRLATQFAEVLGLDRVGIDDDFFTLGGDSILAIRLVNLARRDGITLTPRQIFELRTPAAIARLVGETDSDGVESANHAAPVVDGVGEVVPLPVVHRLSEWSGGTDRFNQAMLLHTPTGADVGAVTAALQAVLDHHDGLRSRLTRHAPGVWTTETTAAGTVSADAVLTVVTAPDPEALRRIVTEQSEAATARLSPAAGVMVQAVWFDLGPDAAGRLLVVAHHLVVDGVSWRILLEDLAMAYVAVSSEQVPALDPVQTSLRGYSAIVAEDAARRRRIAELDHWTETTRPGAALVPEATGPATVGSGAQHRVSLSVDDSLAVLTTVPAMAHADVTDVLLTALRIAVTRWHHETGRAESDLLVDLERHGREELTPGVDLSRTVGWFTSISPVRLRPGQDPLSELKDVKERLRAAPDGGIGYGMLRYANARTAGPLGVREQSQILFNYLGRMPSADLGDAAAWTPAPETDALSTDPDADMGGPYRLIVNALCEDTSDGPVLTAVFGRSDLGLTEADGEALSRGWAQAVRELVSAAARHDGPGELTPSDVPLVALTQPELDRIGVLSPAGVEAVWPLSPLQEGLYFQATFDVGADIYTAQFSLDFEHHLDVDRLDRALRTLQRRNPTLRAGFVSEGLGAPVQFVTADLAVPIVEFDLRELEPAERETHAAELMATDRITPFDLAAPPLWRAMVIRLDDDRDRLVVNRQFLLWDGWSNGIVVSQLLALYESGGDDSGFPAVAGRFEEYLGWLAGRDADEGRARWREALAGLDEPTLVGTAVPGEPVAPDRRDAVLSVDLGERLRARAADTGVTLNALLSGALALVLGTQTGRADVVFGTTVAGRPPEVEGLDTVAGLFLNTVPVRATLRPSETVAELLRRSQSERLGLMPHDYLGLATIQRESEHRQLFDVLYVLQNFVDENQVSALNDAHDISGGDSVDHTHYPLTVVVTPGTRMRVKFEFRPERLDSETVEAMLARFVALLEGFADDVSTAVGSLDLSLPAERAALSVGSAERALPEATIADLFAEAARRTPDEVALVFGERQVTYLELDGRINAAARLLLAHGAGPERIVALGLPRSVEMVVALFAVLRTGSAYLPLELDHPAERLLGMLDDARPVVLVTTREVRETFDGFDGATVLLDDTAAGHATGPLTDEELGGFAPGTPGRLDHPAYVIYTSGSTGKPKGVVTGYRGLTNMQFNHRAEIFDPTISMTGGRRLRIAHTVSFAFDMSWEELLWLVEGHEVHICDEHLRRDAEALVAYCNTHRVDVVNVTPTYAQHLFEEGLLDDGPGEHRPPLVLLGGEAVPDSVWNRLRDTDGTFGYNLYGPTEYTINTLGASTGDSATPTVGTPIWNTRAHILDGWLRPVPAGVPGELYIAGIGLARGYLDRFGLTAERFVADPFEPGGRMYRTGDLVRRGADGHIDYLGRTDDQVKIRGHRIELGEIESVLAGLDGVRQCAVIAAPGPGGVKRLVAYVVPSGTVSAVHPNWGKERAQALRASLPEYMVPSAFVTTESLPMTVNGKLDVRALPPVPDTVGGGSRGPADHVEEALCALFGELLDVTGIGVEDSFFDLGGHSLLATRLISRARSALATELSMRDLFEAPTVAELAERVRGGAGAIRPALAAAVRPEVLPLSTAQQRLWLIQQIEGQSAAYNFPIVLRMRGELDAAVFATALADVVGRHESLRTVFTETDGVPAQRILDSATPELSVVDGTEDEIADLVRGAVLRPFDLTREIPVRGTVIRLGERDQVLALVLHHIATDEWSDRPFLRDLMVAYASRKGGQAPQWEPLAVQYADYTLWQRDLLGDHADPESVLSKQLSYWESLLSGAPEELVLPTDRARPARPSFAGGAVEFDLDPSTTAGLRTIAAERGASMFMVLHAAAAALLTRLGAGDDLPLGAPIAGRTEEGLDDLVGFFVNILVLRTDVSGNPTFAELLDRVRELDLAAFANADVPFESVVERLNPARSLARNPLFQVMVGYHSRTADLTELGDLTLEAVPLQERTAKFDLVFNFTEYLHEDRIGLRLEYGADLFDRSTADAVARRQLALLDAVARDPESPVSAVDVFLPGERDRVLVAFNDTERVVPEETLDESFARWVRATPDAVAVVDEGARATYAQLDQRSDRIAAALASRGVGAESVVALAVPRSVDMVASVLAVLKLGAAYLPLDLNHPADRISYMLTDSAAAVLLSTLAEAERIATVPGLTRVLLDEPGTVTELDAAVAPDRRVPAGIDHAAYVIYTSGSTGRPKGVVVSHEGISSLVATAEDRMRLTQGSVVMQFASVGFDVAVFELSMALCTGSRLVIVPDHSRVAGPELTDFMHEHAVTHAIIPPSLMAALPPGCDVPEGCTVLVGTETVPPDLIGRWAERLNLLAAYGLTEATVNNTLWQAQPGWNQAVPIGIPDPNEQAFVLDARLRPVPVGVAGELYIAGRGLARGYLGKPGLTAGRFVANPFGPGRMYRTGDLARWRADGNVDFLGRVDDQVKIRGFRIELGEIVAALADHPEVNQATVIADRDGGIARLIGYVVPVAGAVVDPASVRAHVAASLPDYMVPSVVITLDGPLPLTPNGKLDRKALPAPDWAELTGDVAPRTDRERMLAELFAEILHLPSVGVHDNFFELGGHSMASMQLVGRVRARLGAQLSIREVFDSPTVAELAALTERTGAAERPLLVPTPRSEGGVPLSPSQRRQWRHYRNSAAASHALSLYPGRRLDVAALTAALADVVARHEPLRTGFVELDGCATGRSAGSAPEVTARAVPAPEVEFLDAGDADLRALVYQLAQRPMDLDEHAPLRVYLVDGADGEQTLLLVMHYLAVDEWSVVPLLGELLAAYTARVEGAEPELPVLPVGYADYVAWSAEVLGDPSDESSRYATELGYWRDRLAGLPERIVLPGERPGGAPRGDVVALPIDERLHEDIDALARRTGTSMFMVLQSVLAAVLTETGAGEDLPIGALVAGRPEEALSGLIGCFADTVVLRTDTSGDPTFAELLARVRESNLAALEHQDIGFDDVAIDLGGEVLRPQVTIVHHEQARLGAVDGVFGGLLPVPVGAPVSDLTLSFYEPVGPGPVHAFLGYRADALESERVQELAERLCVVLVSVCENEGRRLGQVGR
ncbi:amino acid adenylation domain-containing protein [Rhodococcus spelaei]|uniref:Amino acid adenylation domain-containing protein n=1 Tax=Rhodococcus spelaei TaxID=2546320 RepID=A0A541BS67_9NOCA|nr:non-ribosomal peptide synthetase [Rhodococcus spelaei]TQF75181.1 amino acid adenylation domain-containing protein [Rhodococcus spelaei]